MTLFFFLVQIAASLNAEKLILMTDVPGILKDKDNVESKYTVLDIKGTRQLMAEGIIAGGMIPKVWLWSESRSYEEPRS